jgi:hypothetical protein
MRDDVFEAFSREVKTNAEALKRLEDNIQAVRGLMLRTESDRLANLPPLIIQELI